MVLKFSCANVGRLITISNLFFTKKEYAATFGRMDDKTLGTYIKNVSERITDEDVPLLAACAQKRTLKKGEQLLKEGEMCRAIYLVENGYLRTWYNKDGDIINLNFTFEGGFTTNLRSINHKQSSAYIIEAGENSSVWVFDLDKITRESPTHEAVKTFLRRLAIHILLVLEKHSNLFKLYTPAERYKYIEKHNPQLLQRISLKQLASYLGVTRETLSRIRGKNH